MKNELISLCEELEGTFDEKLERYEDRLDRIDHEIKMHVQTLKESYPDNTDIAQLEQLIIGLRRTHRLVHAKLQVIQDNGQHLLDELGAEIKDRVPDIRRKIEDSATYEQASIEIQKEAHSASESFKDFFKALMMWRATPEEHLAESQKNISPNTQSKT